MDVDCECTTGSLHSSITNFDHHAEYSMGMLAIKQDSGFKTIALSTSIIAEYKVAELLSKSILQTFKWSAILLELWHDVTAKWYPTRVYLLQFIPRGEDI